MDPTSRKDIILEQIKVEYGTIANFSRQTGIPDSSIRNIKNRSEEDIDGMAVGNFIKICKALHLDAEDLIEGKPKPRPDIMRDQAWLHYLKEMGSLPGYYVLLSKEEFEVFSQYKNLKSPSQIRVFYKIKDILAKADSKRPARSVAAEAEQMQAQPSHSIEDDARAEAEAYYQEILAEKKARASSASSPNAAGADGGYKLA